MRGPTGPNRSTGSLHQLRNNPPRTAASPAGTREDTSGTRMQDPGPESIWILGPAPWRLDLSFPGLVAIARGHTPDPIPNSAVKTLSANGTASQDAGE